LRLSAGFQRQNAVGTNGDPRIASRAAVEFLDGFGLPSSFVDREHIVLGALTLDVGYLAKVMGPSK